MKNRKPVFLFGLVALLAMAPLAAPMAQTSEPPASAPTPPPTAEAYPPIRQRNGILVDVKGRGLYTYDGDTDPGKSNCDAQCRLLWPPIFADAGAQPRGPFTLVQRKDGRQQWAYKGKPLYRWISDKKRGDAGGDGVSGVWHLVRVPKPVPTYTPEPVRPTPAKP